MSLSVLEVFDGRLPEYQVVDGDVSKYIVIKTFDTFEEAEKWCSQQNNKGITPCGEDDPCS